MAWPREGYTRRGRLSMDTSSTLASLYRHMEWADAATLQAVVSRPETASDARLLDLAYHVHLVQSYFRKSWIGEELTVPPLDAFADMRAVARWAREVHGELRETLGSVQRLATRMDSTLAKPDIGKS